MEALRRLVLSFVFVSLTFSCSRGGYPQHTDAFIRTSVVRGATTTQVIKALGQPDERDGKVWHYHNALTSYRRGKTFVPESIGIAFTDDMKVEFIVTGPRP